MADNFDSKKLDDSIDKVINALGKSADNLIYTIDNLERIKKSTGNMDEKVGAMFNEVENIARNFATSGQQIRHLKSRLKHSFEESLKNLESDTKKVHGTYYEESDKYTKYARRAARRSYSDSSKMADDVENSMTIVGSAFLGPLGLLASSVATFFSQKYGSGNTIKDMIQLFTKIIPDRIKKLLNIGDKQKNDKFQKQLDEQINKFDTKINNADSKYEKLLLKQKDNMSKKQYARIDKQIKLYNKIDREESSVADKYNKRLAKISAKIKGKQDFLKSIGVKDEDIKKILSAQLNQQSKLENIVNQFNESHKQIQEKKGVLSNIYSSSPQAKKQAEERVKKQAEERAKKQAEKQAEEDARNAAIHLRQQTYQAYLNNTKKYNNKYTPQQKAAASMNAERAFQQFHIGTSQYTKPYNVTRDEFETEYGLHQWSAANMGTKRTRQQPQVENNQYNTDNQNKEASKKTVFGVSGIAGLIAGLFGQKGLKKALNPIEGMLKGIGGYVKKLYHWNVTEFLLGLMKSVGKGILSVGKGALGIAGKIFGSKLPGGKGSLLSVLTSTSLFKSGSLLGKIFGGGDLGALGTMMGVGGAIWRGSQAIGYATNSKLSQQQKVGYSLQGNKNGGWGGALQGGVQGQMIGSFAGIPGMIVGAGLGALLGGIGGKRIAAFITTASKWVIAGLQQIQKYQQVVWSGIKIQGLQVWSSIKAIGTQTWNVIKTVGTQTWNGIKLAGESYWKYISTVGTQTWNVIKTVGTQTWNGIKLAGTQTWNGIKTIGTSIWSSIQNQGTQIWNPIQKQGTSIWNDIKNTIMQILHPFQQVGKGVQNVAGTVKKGAVNTYDSVKNAVGGFWNNVVGKTKNVLGFAKGGAINKTKDTIPAMLSPGEYIINSGLVKQNPDLISLLNSQKQNPFNLITQIFKPAIQSLGTLPLITKTVLSDQKNKIVDNINKSYIQPTKKNLGSLFGNIFTDIKKQQNSKQFTQNISSGFSKITGTFSKILPGISKIQGPTLSKVQSGLGGLLSTVQPALGPAQVAISQALPVVGQLWGQVKNTPVGKQITNSVIKPIENIFSSIGQLFGAIINGPIGKIAAVGLNMITSPIKMLTDGITFIVNGITFIVNDINSISNIFTNNPITNFIKGVTNFVKNIFGFLNPVKGIISTGSTIFNTIVNIVKGIVNFIKNIFGFLNPLNAIGGVANAVGGVAGGITKGIGGFFGGIGKTVSGLFGGHSPNTINTQPTVNATNPKTIDLMGQRIKVQQPPKSNDTAKLAQSLQGMKESIGKALTQTAKPQSNTMVNNSQQQTSITHNYLSEDLLGAMKV